MEVNMIRKLALWIVSIKLLSFAVLELILGKGLWSLFKAHNLPPGIAESGSEWLYITVYISWILIDPIIFGIALLIKDRGFLLEHSRQ
jgi:uncharacterized membrane protein (DUF2068 family)